MNRFLAATRLLFAAALVLAAAVPATAAGPRERPPVPDLTAGGKPLDDKTITLGPTGMRGWVWGWQGHTTLARQILVTDVATGSPAAGSATSAAESADSTHETRDVLGWTLHVNRSLVSADAAATETAVNLLEKQLAEVVRVVPAAAVAELRQTPLWFSPEYPGVGPKAEFHPDANWLRNNGRDPVMARAIEFTNIRIFPQECERMPNFALHELAHAYHFRVLGFDDPAIRDAFERARAAGLYDKVEQHHGNGRPNSVGRAYAMTDEKEYFAETSEAYFSRNDFFPFTRDQLAAHDPRMLRVLETAWGVASKTTGAD